MLKFLFSFLLLIPIWVDNPKLIKVKLTKAITASIPETFTQMTDDELANKYPSSRKPVLMFVSPDKQVDFGINVSSQKWPGSDLKVLKDFYKANLFTLFNNVEIIKEDIKNINGQEFIVYEFTSEVKPDEKAVTPQNPIRKYTYIQYTLNNDYLLIFNFSCPVTYKSEWQKTASAIMGSIKINKSSKPTKK